MSYDKNVYIKNKIQRYYKNKYIVKKQINIYTKISERANIVSLASRGWLRQLW